MDFGEKGLEATEIATEEAIAKAREQVVKVAITGTCNNIRCGDDCGARPFCGPKCRDAYDEDLAKGRL